MLFDDVLDPETENEIGIMSEKIANYGRIYKPMFYPTHFDDYEVVSSKIKGV